MIHYTPTVITSSSLTVGNGGAVVLMEPSGLITAVTSNGAEDENQQHHHHHHHQQQQVDGGEDEASASNNADHSPIHLPSTTFLNTHISKSVDNPFSIIVSCLCALSFYYRNIIPTLTAEELVCADEISSPIFSCPRWFRSDSIFFFLVELRMTFWWESIDCTNWGN